MCRLRTHIISGIVLALSWAAILRGDLTVPGDTIASADMLRLVSEACTGGKKNGTIKDVQLIANAAAEAASMYAMEAELLLAVMAQESRCLAHARSPRGAIGMMQLMPATAKAMGAKRPDRMRENILAGARYLDALGRQFKGDRTLMLAAYNAGPAAVAKFKRVPPYKETTRYVEKVLSSYKRLNDIKLQTAASSTAPALAAAAG